MLDLSIRPRTEQTYARAHHFSDKGSPPRGRDGDGSRSTWDHHGVATTVLERRGGGLGPEGRANSDLGNRRRRAGRTSTERAARRGLRRHRGSRTGDHRADDGRVGRGNAPAGGAFVPWTCWREDRRRGKLVRDRGGLRRSWWEGEKGLRGCLDLDHLFSEVLSSETGGSSFCVRGAQEWR